MQKMSEDIVVALKDVTSIEVEQYVEGHRAEAFLGSVWEQLVESRIREVLEEMTLVWVLNPDETRRSEEGGQERRSEYSRQRKKE